MNTQHGYIDFKGYKTYYEVHGDLSLGITPLLVLHGGPGYPHYHLQPLEALAEQGIPVIFYDQLGCGESDRPDDVSLWTITLFVEELAAIRTALGLTKINILGHSWGGTLALEYMFTKPIGVEKLILSSTLFDTKLWISETDKLKDKLPASVATTMRTHEQAGTTDTKEYTAAYQQFVENFVCRIVPQPAILDQADAEWGKQVYETMWGPNEATATGTLSQYSSFDRLSEITIPTLLLSGRYDEATPSQIEKAQQGIKGAKWIMLENSSHAGCFEETDKYLELVANHLLAS